MIEYKIKKRFIEDVLQGFQGEHNVVFRDQKQARMLIEYSVAKFLIESNAPAERKSKGSSRP